MGKVLKSSNFRLSNPLRSRSSQRGLSHQVQLWVCSLILGFTLTQIHHAAIAISSLDYAAEYPVTQDANVDSQAKMTTALAIGPAFQSQQIQEFSAQAQATLTQMAQFDIRVRSEQLLSQVRFGVSEFVQSTSDSVKDSVKDIDSEKLLAQAQVRKSVFRERVTRLGERLQQIRSEETQLQQKLQSVAQAIQYPDEPLPMVDRDLELADLSTFPPTAAVSSTPITHQREFRGVWVASVVNIDWPSKPGLPVLQQQFELLAILDRMGELNLNALVLQIRPNGDAFYESAIEPWSSWLTGTQGKAPEPYYDPLQFAIEQCHKRNIELHAWFNPYRARLNREKSAYAPNHMAVMYPQYTYRYGDLVWMDPGAQEIQDRTYAVIMDVVQRYDVDGIHIDDYFYPYPKSGISFPDNQTYNAYRTAGGTLGLADWRRQNVNQMIQRLAEGIKQIKPHVKFGISPFGIYRPGKAPGIEGMDQYDAIYADVKLWMDQGWVDYLAPQLYWSIDRPQQSYPVLLNWWLRNNPWGRHIYAGNYLSKVDTEWPVSEIQRQVDISRRGAGQLSLGNIFFSMKVFRDNRKGVNDIFKRSVYPAPALVPPMPWLDNTPPASPTGVQSSSGIVTWNVGPEEIRSWTLYQLVGNTWQLRDVLSYDVTAVQVEPGTYALRAVDRMANESAEEIVVVQ
ncbi:MAG: glycoside hydrolase family 10 protein [Microcoleaceae cyanobacterium]